MRLSRSTGEFKLVRPRGNPIGSSVRRLRRRWRSSRGDRPARRLSPGAWLLAVLAVLIIGTCAWVLLGTSVLGVRQVKVTGTSVAAEVVQRAKAGDVVVTMGAPPISLMGDELLAALAGDGDARGAGFSQRSADGEAPPGYAARHARPGAGNKG